MEEKGFLALVREYDQRLAEEVRARLEDAPVETFTVSEAYENAPAETKITGRVLFLDLHTPASDTEGAASWSAVLSEDGKALTFWQTYRGGGTYVGTRLRSTTYAKATNESPNGAIHPLAWLAAARMLGIPYPGAKGEAAPSGLHTIPVPGVGFIIGVPGGRRVV
jgi:hypothetical protein